MTLLKIRARGTNVDGAVWENTYFLETDIAVDQDDAANIVTSCREYLERMYDTIAGIVYSTVDAVEFIVNVIDIVTGLETYLAGGAWEFTSIAASQALPPHDTSKLRFPAVGFQRGKSLAMPGLTENDQFNGDLQAATISDYVDFGAQFFIPPPTLGGISYDPVLWRPSTGNIVGFLNTLIINIPVRTQRQRSKGRGE